MQNIGSRFILVALIALFAGLASLAVACGDDDDDGASAEEIQEVEDIVRQLFESDGSNIDFVLEHATDNLFATVFFTTREDCQAAPDECIGDPETPTLSDTEISGDSATTIAAAGFGTFEVALVREDEVWKADSLRATSDEVPEGAATVDLSLTDFAFTFNAEDIPADGNFAFAVSNDGEQGHEVAVAAIPADVDLVEALDTVEEPDALKVFIHPGQEVDMAFDAPLGPGRYALVCFFPDVTDPEGTPHAFKGMLSEFTIE